jgi:hypothetical protein
MLVNVRPATSVHSFTDDLMWAPYHFDTYVFVTGITVSTGSASGSAVWWAEPVFDLAK